MSRTTALMAGRKGKEIRKQKKNEERKTRRGKANEGFSEFLHPSKSLNDDKRASERVCWENTNKTEKEA